MCGINGIIQRHRSAHVDPATLDRMTDVLAHRGPDGRGTAIWSNVGLGHRRLAIIDLDTGQQPMATPDGEIAITFNGEIYNYLELRSDLIARGYKFRTTSDTEVLLYLYESDGVAMLERLNGMFAFAIYDRKKGQILLARDRFGEKPLYFYQDDQRVLFASEIKAILAAGVEARPDMEGVHQYITFQYCIGTRTMFEGVRTLRPASYLVLSDTGEVLDDKEYWALPYEEDHSKDEEYYTNELRFLLEDAVKIRLRSDVPVGTYLSGGLDSSTVSAMSSKLMGRGVPAFTGFFSESERYSELPYASAVAKQNRSPHFTVDPSAGDFEAHIRRIIYHMDEPAAGPGAFAQYMVSRLAAERVKVVLGGQGGDELFGGYARYLMLYLEESIKGAIFESQDPQKHIVTLDRVLPSLPMLRGYVPLLRQFWSQGLFEPVEKRYYWLINRNPDVERLYTPDFLASRSEERVYAEFEKEFNRILDRTETHSSALLNRMTSYDAHTMLQSLLHVEDRMSMAFGLESRLPLLDHRIAELAFRMPPRLKYRDGRGKAILANAAKTFLPVEVVQRKDKMGFPVPLAEWASGPLKPLIESILLGPAARRRGIYNMDAIAALAREEKAFGRELWGLISLELWFQIFIDGQGKFPTDTATPPAQGAA